MKTLQNKMNAYTKANTALLAKLKISTTPTIVFPNGKVSFLSKIAIKILNRAGGKIDWIFNETTK